MSESGYYTLGRNPHQIIRDGSFATKKQFIHNELFNHHIVEHNIVIQGLLKKLHALYIHEKIPDFFGYYFMGQLRLCSEERISDSINRQIQLLKGKKSHFHLIMKHIQVREACLRSITQCLDALFEQQRPAQMDKLREQVKHLRQLSVWVIEHIRQWKKSLLFLSQNVFEDEHISFFYHGEDYLLKILKDADFIAKSFLGQKVSFSHKQDPFLMRPCTNDYPANQFTSLFEFSSEEQQTYMKCLQFLADERADYLKRKIMAKTDKIKQIQRVYQARQLQEKVIITKPNPIALRKAKMSTSEVPIDFIEESNKEEETRKPLRSNSLSEMRESKAKQLLIKGDKIKKIKQMQLGSSSPLINFKKFSSLQPSNPNDPPINRSISLGIFKKMSSKIQNNDRQKESQTDFESLVRKKELQVLDNDRSKRRTNSSIRLKDRLSERKPIDNKQGAEELRKILDQIEHSSPQKQQSFFIRRDNPSRGGKTLLQQNQQIMTNLRESILKEISDDAAAKQKNEQKKREENSLMEKLIKTKLEQQTLKQIEKERVKWTEGKDVLAHELNKRGLFDLQQPTSRRTEKLSQLEEELKREMQLKFLREVHEQLKHKEAMFKHEKQKNKQEKERDKELQLVMRKQHQENRFKQIEDEERKKAMQLIMQEEQRKKKEIQNEMQDVIQKQQERLLTFSNEQKLKLQAELRENMKQKLLVNLKKQKSVLASQREAQEKQRILEEAHRAQVRKKMEEEFQIQKHVQRQRQRQQKTRKLRLIAQKMDHLSQEQQLQAKLVREESIKQQKIEQLKQSMAKIPKMSSKVQQQSKRKLREEFELQLFAFNRPQNFNLQQNNFVIKDFKAQIDNDQNLNRKFSEFNASEVASQDNKQQKTEFIPKQSSLKASKLQPSQFSQNFVRFSQIQKQPAKEEEYDEQQLRQKGINMAPAEYAIYRKKKLVLDQKKVMPVVTMNQKELFKVRHMLDNFQKMSNLDSDKPDSAIIPESVSNMPQTHSNKQQSSSKQPKIQSQISPKKAPRKKSQEISQDLSEVMKLTVHSKMGSIHKKKFVTSDQDEDNQGYGRRKKANHRKNNQKKTNIKKSQQQQEQNLTKTFQKKAPIVESATFKTVFIDDLDNYLISHFQKLPRVIRKLNLLKKDQLLKSFDDYKSVTIIEVGSPSEVEGIVIVVENENKQNIRSINIIHFGAYKMQDTLKILIKARDLLFNCDPCAEITFSMYYNKTEVVQEDFIRQFEKQFDPYGAIFQKKISNEQTERKHIVRRMIGEVSQPLAKNKAIGQLKVQQNFVSHQAEHSLGIELGLTKTGRDIGSWTMLGLFLSQYGKEEQIVEQLTSHVSEESKNIKHLSKMAMKLKNNRYPDMEFQNFSSPFEANLRLIQLGSELVKCDPKIQENHIPITLMRNTLVITPVLPFVSASVNFHHKDVEKIGKFLRFRCGTGSKIIKLKSSLYSNVVTVVPCKPNNYKILLTDAHEFDSIADTTSLDLYFKLFLANIAQHSQSNQKHIWIPQIAAQGNFELEYAKDFGLSSQIRNKMEFMYTEYMPNCIGFKPTHRDLFITPPFLIAVINSNIEKDTEGSPVYLQRIDISDLVEVTNLPQLPPQSDY